MVKKVLLSAIALLLANSQAKGAMIWNEDFESGNFSKWNGSVGNWSVVSSSLSAHSGNRGADIKGSTAPDDDLISVNLSSAGFENLEWSYWFKVRDALESADFIYAEWTANGSDWNTLATYSNIPSSDWQYANFILPATSSENPNLGFRFRANLGSSTDRMNIDDVSLVGTAVVPEPSSFILLSSSFLFFLRRRN